MVTCHPRSKDISRSIIFIDTAVGRTFMLKVVMQLLFGNLFIFPFYTYIITKSNPKKINSVLRGIMWKRATDEHGEHRLI